MPEKLLVFLFLLLVAYWIRSGLRYEIGLEYKIFATPRPDEYFTPTQKTYSTMDEITIDESNFRIEHPDK